MIIGLDGKTFQALFLIAIFHAVNLRELPKSPTDCLGQDVDKFSRILPPMALTFTGQMALSNSEKFYHLLSFNANNF